MKRILSALFVGTVVAGAPAYAHHSFAADYFEEATVSIAGELVEFQYRNPHSIVYVMAKDENGQMQRFAAEWGSPNRLARQGVTSQILKPGDYVILTGSPGRNPAEHKLHLKAIHRPSDGWKAGR